MHPARMICCRFQVQGSDKMDVAASLGHKEITPGQPSRHVRCYNTLPLCICLGSGRAGGLIHTVRRGERGRLTLGKSQAAAPCWSWRQPRIGAMAALGWRRAWARICDDQCSRKDMCGACATGQRRRLTMVGGGRQRHGHGATSIKNYRGLKMAIRAARPEPARARARHGSVGHGTTEHDGPLGRAAPVHRA